MNQWYPFYDGPITVTTGLAAGRNPTAVATGLAAGSKPKKGCIEREPAEIMAGVGRRTPNSPVPLISGAAHQLPGTQGLGDRS